MTTAPPILQRHAAIKHAVSVLAARGESSLVLWYRLAPALGKIIGDTGFESMLIRCLYQVEVNHPWLAFDHHAGAKSIDHLAACLATRELAESEAISTSLLLIFTDTLNALIGELVTNRILLAAWGTLAVEDVPEPSK